VISTSGKPTAARGYDVLAEATSASEREQELMAKLARSQQALQRAREELKRRGDYHAAGGGGGNAKAGAPEKPDWSLALRYRLTAELRSELASVQASWQAEQKASAAKVHALQASLDAVTREKEAMVSRLLQEVLELQRLFAAVSAQREAMWATLRPEIRNAEKEHEAHVEELRDEFSAADSARAAECARLRADVGRLNAALTGVCEDLEDERRRRKQQTESSGREIERLRGDVERLTSELGLSQQMHARDVGQLRSAKTALEVEMEQTRASMTRSLENVTTEKEQQASELSDALRVLRQRGEEREASLQSRLEQTKLEASVEASALRARITHMRELQRLAHVGHDGTARQALILDSLKETDRRESPYWRGDRPPRPSTSSDADGDADAHAEARVERALFSCSSAFTPAMHAGAGPADQAVQPAATPASPRTKVLPRASTRSSKPVPGAAAANRPTTISTPRGGACGGGGGSTRGSTTRRVVAPLGMNVRYP
jgi:hypothetical protein